MSIRIARNLARATRTTLVPLALLAACQERTAIVEPLDGARDAAVVDFSQTNATVAWNEVARALVAKYATSAPASIRGFALLSVSQCDAIVAAEKGAAGPTQPATAGAVAGASAAVLAYVYPQESAYLESLVQQQKDASQAPGRAPSDFASGESIGREVAAGMLERAKTDRFFAPFTGTVPICPGCWVAQPTPPAFATLGQAKPYFLASNAQFRPAPPPAFGSPEFAAALAEVKQIADTRTPVQDSIAKFWALPAGTIGAQGYFNLVAAELTVKYRRTERETAHALALLNISAYDAIVASHEAKYHYWLIRPSQADPAIVRAIGLPSFPAYPSNHSALAASAATVLGALFPAERSRLDAMAAEGAISRLYGGIHYRFDTEVGMELGRRVAAWTLAHDVVGHQRFAFE